MRRFMFRLLSTTREVFVRYWPALVAMSLALLWPTVALADTHEPTHELVIVEQTRALLSDVASYLKFLLPTIAIAYAIYGGIQRATAGDDEMRKMRADRTFANAKLGLVIGLVAAPVLHWIQQYYS